MTTNLSNEPCILDTKGLQKSGYARTYFKGKNWSSHRLAYFQKHGSIPKGKIICHRCNVRNCINPNHLYAGTYKDNSNDCFKSGRHNYLSRTQFMSRGEKHGLARMTKECVKLCRDLFDHKAMRIADLARFFEMERTSISFIVKRKTWRHVK